MEFLAYPLALIVTLGILVTFHELGHYVVARWSGVTITRFSVGFGTPLWSRVDSRGTEFVLAAIPLGGYVRMLDLPQENEASVNAERAARTGGTLAYGDLTPLWRIAIAAAGPLANFILAIAVYWVLAVSGTTSIAPRLGELAEDSAMAQAGAQLGQEIRAVDGVATRSWQQVSEALASRLGETGSVVFSVADPASEPPATAVASASAAVAEAGLPTVTVPIVDWLRGESQPDLLGALGLNPRHPPVIGMVLEDSPATRAGLRTGDLIVSIDGTGLTSWREWVDAIQAAPGQRLEVTVRRDDRPLTLTLVPDAIAGETADGASVETGYLGVGPGFNDVRYGPVAAIGPAFEQTADKIGLTLGLLKKMVFGQVSMQNLSGPITIAEVAGNSARLGIVYFLGVLALLSISLGVLNLLPIPILDGGHIVWATAELIRGRPVPDSVQVIGAQVGLFLVGSLMVIALYNDFARLLQ